MKRPGLFNLPPVLKRLPVARNRKRKIIKGSCMHAQATESCYQRGRVATCIDWNIDFSPKLSHHDKSHQNCYNKAAPRLVLQQSTSVLHPPAYWSDMVWIDLHGPSTVPKSTCQWSHIKPLHLKNISDVHHGWKSLAKTKHGSLQDAPQYTRAVCLRVSIKCLYDVCMYLCAHAPVRLSCHWSALLTVSCFCWLAKRPGLETTAAGEKHALEFLQQPSDLLTGQRSIVRFKDCVTSGYVFIFGKPTLPRKQVGVPFSPHYETTCLSMQSLRLSK